MARPWGDDRESDPRIRFRDDDRDLLQRTRLRDPDLRPRFRDYPRGHLRDDDRTFSRPRDDYYDRPPPPRLCYK
jgi:hypothetical protein